MNVALQFVADNWHVSRHAGNNMLACFRAVTQQQSEHTAKNKQEREKRQEAIIRKQRGPVPPFVLGILFDQCQGKTKDTVPALQPVNSPNQAVKGIKQWHSLL